MMIGCGLQNTFKEIPAAVNPMGRFAVNKGIGLVRPQSSTLGRQQRHFCRRVEAND
jgi:hypothetical protein